MYTLLALCARGQGHPAQYHQLAEQAQQLSTWLSIPRQAEAQGLAPLLYIHTQKAGVALPVKIKRELQGLYLRHRYANQVRARVVVEILKAFQTANIPALILKGAALAPWVYDEPGLRPMRDIDILVKKSQARQAQMLLVELGFEAPLPEPLTKLPAKHLAVAQRMVDGLLVSVEVHHNLYDSDSPKFEFDALFPKSIAFPLLDVSAYTLGYEDMLSHIYRHMTNLFTPLRLIWVADLISTAERFATDIDWSYLKHRHPQILRSLALLHHSTPLSEALLSQAPFDIKRPPTGIGLEFQGWPRYDVAAQRRKGYLGIWHDSFFPSEWWVRLQYGAESKLQYWTHRWGQHPLNIMGWFVHYLLNRG